MTRECCSAVRFATVACDEYVRLLIILQHEFGTFYGDQHVRQTGHRIDQHVREEDLGNSSEHVHVYEESSRADCS